MQKSSYEISVFIGKDSKFLSGESAMQTVEQILSSNGCSAVQNFPPDPRESNSS